MGKLKAIQSCPQLAELPPLELALIASIVELRQLQEGQTLFTAGESGDTLFMLVDGTVAVYGPKSKPESKPKSMNDKPLLQLEAGELIAEMALLGSSKHRVTIRVVSDAATLACITHDGMKRLMGAKPEVAAKLLAAVGSAVSDKVEAALR